MCGIVGYIGHQDAHSIIIKGLQRLEYRGYDSAGIALYDGKNVKVTKTKGKVSDLQKKINSCCTYSKCGLCCKFIDNKLKKKSFILPPMQKL